MKSNRITKHRQLRFKLNEPPARLHFPLTNREQAIAEIFAETITATIGRLRMTERVKMIDAKQQYSKVWKLIHANDIVKKQINDRIRELERINATFESITAAMLQDAPAMLRVEGLI